MCMVEALPVRVQCAYVCLCVGEGEGGGGCWGSVEAKATLQDRGSTAGQAALQGRGSTAGQSQRYRAEAVHQG